MLRSLSSKLEEQRVICTKSMTSKNLLLFTTRLSIAMEGKVLKLKIRHATKQPPYFWDIGPSVRFLSIFEAMK